MALPAAQVIGRFRPALYHNKKESFGPQNYAWSRWSLYRHHGTPGEWWRHSGKHVKPQHVELHDYTPRVLLDRHLYHDKVWVERLHLPDESRWEKFVNGRRVTEDRWSLVEEEGQVHKVNWKLYSQRISAEVKASYDALPSFRYEATSLPIWWRSLDTVCAVVNRLSVREALVQCKLGTYKSHRCMHYALEQAMKGAEAKGLDKDKLRVTEVFTLKGPTDRSFNLRSKGFYSWVTKHSASIHLVVSEDPEMVLPDRTRVPYQVEVALRRAGIATKQVVLDVPAITAEGI